MAETKTRIRISVRNLVEHVLRTGDIDNRVGKQARQEAMQEGSRIHRKIQRRMGADYHAEVGLKIELDKENYCLVVEGRADGIIIEEQADSIGRVDGIEHANIVHEAENANTLKDSRVTIDEIKGIYKDVQSMEEPVEVHLAQAKCYAYIYGSQNDLETIQVQMTYVNLDTEEIRYFHNSYTMEELTEWFEEIIASYQKWADFQWQWRQIRQASIQQLEFPFEYRPGQKNLVTDVYRTILRKKILFIQAPTGVGKTISTVFPAVKAVGEGLGDKIFYLTAKTITRTVAKDTFSILAEQGYQGKVLELTAKEKLCLCDEMDCNPVNCPYAKGHYDRVNDAVYDLITRGYELTERAQLTEGKRLSKGEQSINENLLTVEEQQMDGNFFTREVFLEQAEKYKVCPFELSLDTSLWSDVIICDYNYVFDPNVYLKRFFADGTKGDYLFLVDEAHNLVERGREMYSAHLTKESFLKQKKILKHYSKKLEQRLEKCNKQMLEWKRECEDYMIHDNTGAFIFTLMQLGAELDKFLQTHPEFPERKEVSEFYLNLRHFLNIFDVLDENYVIYTDFNEEGEFCLHLYCVNPSANIQERLDRGISTVFFSATLLPIQYYKNLLSTKEDNYAVYAQSVFSQEQRLLMIGRDVSSLYTRRNRLEFSKIAKYIYQTARAKTGNYLVFFPSYKMMEQVYEEYLQINLATTECIIQKNGMTEAQREEFVARFADVDHEENQASAIVEIERKSLVGFCVLGGIFSEGLDLKNQQLIGVIVVGTGLPQICNRREILKNYYQEENEQGFNYAYLYPGMNKVQQAAGRVIRTIEDRGVILLLDERFLRRDYLEMFPREWQDYEVCQLDDVEAKLENFWN